jgi:glycerophosphoryl diester phosphodiesterase family protein
MQPKYKGLSKLKKVIWLYSKYQIITKGLLSIIIFPFSKFILNYLITSSGRTNISSGDYLKFIFSFQGVGALIMWLLLLILLTGIDINAFIIMSALINEGKVQMTARSMVLVAIKSLKSFLRPSGIFIMLYIAIVIPVIGIGITISPMERFQIPNFITSVIFANRLYSAIYYTLVIALFILSIRNIFLFHYILILGDSIKEGSKNSCNLIKRHLKDFLIDFILRFLAIAGTFVLVSIIIMVLLILPYELKIFTLTQSRIFSVFVMLFAYELTAFLTLMTVPLLCNTLTNLFYKYNRKDNIEIKLKLNINTEEINKKAKAKSRAGQIVVLILIIISLVIDTLTAYLIGTNFDEIYKVPPKLAIVAHRAGGDLAAENSLAGLKAAIEKKADWSEIDVQRTKDNKYIINHDNTFKRLTGVNKPSYKMTMEEISKLRIKDTFNSTRPSQKVATLEEFLDTAKGKIGLFIELKGRTANTKMADDVITMVKNRNMENEVVLLSLNYKLIKYIKSNYPEIKTGYIYFFSIGKTQKMIADVLIMEEAEASSDKLNIIKEAGKESYVWTVNSDSSISKFILEDIDGLITDHLDKVIEAIKERDNRMDWEIILDDILS